MAVAGPAGMIGIVVILGLIAAMVVETVGQFVQLFLRPMPFTSIFGHSSTKSSRELLRLRIGMLNSRIHPALTHDDGRADNRGKKVLLLGRVCQPDAANRKIAMLLARHHKDFYGRVGSLALIWFCPRLPISYQSQWSQGQSKASPGKTYQTHVLHVLTT